MKAGPPILIIEDDDETATVVCEVLADAGFRTGRASNGADGLEYLRLHGPPKMILLDLHMPVMDGQQMMRILQREPTWRRIPVVLLTADPQARDKAIEVRAAGYLKKPFSDPDLLAMVGSALRYPS
jgi:two-component system chemotaxis response regulator CheY